MAGRSAVRVGVLGGTFDPIHLGHLVAAEEARYALQLEKVLFLPAARPPHKTGREVSPPGDRVSMVELAIEGNPFFELCLLDVERGGLSYTADTLEILRARLGPKVELFFIVGMDSLAELVTWREPERLISLCRLAVVNRPPYPEVNLVELERELPGVSARVDVVRMPGIYIASSDLQQRVAAGMPIRYQVPDAVEQYIRAAGLYVSPTSP